MTHAKPSCQLLGEDGNIMSLTAKASRAMTQAGLPDLAKEMQGKVFDAGSYDEALQIIMTYVEVH